MKRGCTLFWIMAIHFPFSATALEKENLYISICPEADIICEGQTVEEALGELKREVEKFFGEELPQSFSKITFY
jgi:hypothetical protein